MRDECRITGCEHAGVAGGQLCVDGDTVGDGQAGVAGQVGSWFDADGHHNQVGVQPGAGRRLGAADSTVAVKRDDGGARHEGHLVLFVQTAVDLGQIGTERCLERRAAA